MVHFFQANSGNVAILPLRFRGDLTQLSTTGLANDQMGRKVKVRPTPKTTAYNGTVLVPFRNKQGEVRSGRFGG